MQGRVPQGAWEGPDKRIGQIGSPVSSCQLSAGWGAQGPHWRQLLQGLGAPWTKLSSSPSCDYVIHWVSIGSLGWHQATWSSFLIGKLLLFVVVSKNLPWLDNRRSRESLQVSVLMSSQELIFDWRLCGQKNRCWLWLQDSASEAIWLVSKWGWNLPVSMGIDGFYGGQGWNSWK